MPASRSAGSSRPRGRCRRGCSGSSASAATRSPRTISASTIRARSARARASSSTMRAARRRACSRASLGAGSRGPLAPHRPRAHRDPSRGHALRAAAERGRVAVELGRGRLRRNRGRAPLLAIRIDECRARWYVVPHGPIAVPAPHDARAPRRCRRRLRAATHVDEVLDVVAEEARLVARAPSVGRADRQAASPSTCAAASAATSPPSRRRRRPSLCCSSSRTPSPAPRASSHRWPADRATLPRAS